MFYKPTNKIYTYMLLPLLVDYNPVFWNGLQVHNQKNSEILPEKKYTEHLKWKYSDCLTLPDRSTVMLAYGPGIPHFDTART